MHHTLSAHLQVHRRLARLLRDLPARLTPSFVRRWRTRRGLNRGERYLFDRLRAVRHPSLIGDVIASATLRPTVAGFRRVAAHLASQADDSPRVMGDVVGDEVLVLLKAQGRLYRLAEPASAGRVVDLRHVPVGTRFRIHEREDKVYRVVERGPEIVYYIRTGVLDAVVRAYPKEEGPVNVYLEDAEEYKIRF